MAVKGSGKRGLLVSTILFSLLSLGYLTPAAYATPVDLFPVPVSYSTTLFPSVDDDYLEVAFTQGFTFNFYGTTYTSIFLNTNGGFTFGAGDYNYDPASYDVVYPGVAIFWGDLDAAAWGADTRANQMAYEQFADKFVITYTQLQDNDDSTWNNTATVMLLSDGTITISYGTVGSTDILVGVFDGTHTSDQYLSVQTTYSNYPATGTGIILFDDWGYGPTYAGELNNQTITFFPGQATGGDFILYGTTGGGGSPSGALYAIDPLTGNSTLIGSTGFSEVSDIDFAPDGTLYGVTGGSVGPSDLIRIDPNTGAGTLVGPIGLSGVGLGGIAFAPDGTLYGTACCTPSQLITIDISTGQGTFVAELSGSSGNNWTPGLSFAPDGTLYGSRGGSSGHTEDLVIVNTQTGNLTPIGTATRYVSDLAFAPDGALYGADPAGYLLIIDPATGAKTEVGPVGFTSFSGLASPRTTIITPAVVDLFPIPVSAATTLFPSVDDDYLEVPFSQGFTFNFYGTTYTSIFLNTNGGFTFGAGEWDYDVAASDVVYPGVAIFWGDLNASEYGGYTRPLQMLYKQFPDSFVIVYNRLQDNDDESWSNTATVTLFPDGTIIVSYGVVGSQDILVGIFDGTHTDDRYLPASSFYENYLTTGTGIILFDYWGLGPDYAGELDYRTIVFLSEAGGGGAPGDVNDDGVVDILDAILVLRMAVGL